MVNPKSILEAMEKENRARIKNAIILLTGIKPMEKVESTKYTLKFGVVDPFVFKYDRIKNKDVSIEKIKRSALIKLLIGICNMMEDPGKFIVWTTNNKTFINKQN